MLVVPSSCQFYAIFQPDFGCVAQFGFGPANVIDATLRQKSGTTTRQWSMLTLHTWHDGKDIRGKIGKPERDTACREFSVQRMRDGCRKLANGDGPLSCNVIAATNSLGALGTEQKSGYQVVDVNRVE